MRYEQILYDVRDRVATVTLNRPDKLNAWTAVMGHEVRDAMDRAARDEGVSGGDYYGPSGFLEIRGKTGRARVNPIARDVELGRRLWTLSESMTGIRYLSDA